MKRIYISGKITGQENPELEFEATEQFVKAKYKAQVINPYKVHKELPELKHEEYMRLCFAEIDISDAVYFMENWKESCGASQEMGYAIAKGKEIIIEGESGSRTIGDQG